MTTFGIVNRNCASGFRVYILLYKETICVKKIPAITKFFESFFFFSWHQTRNCYRFEIDNYVFSRSLLTASSIIMKFLFQFILHKTYNGEQTNIAFLYKARDIEISSVDKMQAVRSEVFEPKVRNEVLFDGIILYAIIYFFF